MEIRFWRVLGRLQVQLDGCRITRGPREPQCSGEVSHMEVMDKAAVGVEKRVHKLPVPLLTGCLNAL